MKIVRSSWSAFTRKTTGASCSTNYSINCKLKNKFKYLSTCACERNQPKFLTNLTYFHNYQHGDDSNKGNISVFFGASFAFLGFFEKKEEDEEEEPALITTLKRSVLLIQVISNFFY